MDGTDLVLRALHHGEQDLADELLAVAGRHSAEHEVHHVATDLAAWSREHVERVTRTARRHDLAETLHEAGDDAAALACIAEAETLLPASAAPHRAYLAGLRRRCAPAADR